MYSKEGERMARLDVRVKTEIPVWITRHNGEIVEKTSELSLSGLLIDGWTNKIHDSYVKHDA